MPKSSKKNDLVTFGYQTRRGKAQKSQPSSYETQTLYLFVVTYVFRPKE